MSHGSYTISLTSIWFFHNHDNIGLVYVTSCACTNSILPYITFIPMIDLDYQVTTLLSLALIQCMSLHDVCKNISSVTSCFFPMSCKCYLLISLSFVKIILLSSLPIFHFLYILHPFFISWFFYPYSTSRQVINHCDVDI